MKTFLLTVILSGVCIISFSQITTPIIKANFGVDADMRSNFFNGFIQTGNDDWYVMPGSVGTGSYVIDTTGAASVIAGYNADVSPWPRRMASFYRSMRVPAFTVINNRLWLDAMFIRDYHGNDSTVFTAGSDKNGMTPAMWSGGVQGIPDKNDILDVFMHVRRAGPNTTDSLWMFGGISLDNVTGNRYFDFEMYQTDIYFDRPSAHWYGYGPDAGHTSWKFDAAGNVISAGDVIFNGEFQSGTLTSIQARIWVKKTDWQTITPTAFNWGGLFDGDGSGAVYGYASITPKTTGAFYTGLASSNNTWAGPFGLVLQSNALAFSNPAPASTTNSKYVQDQLIEFSVNLTKLGLDPVTTFGGDVCGTPFNRLVIKTRASSSFTSELKDFVAPIDLFLAPRVIVNTDFPAICDTTPYSYLYVTNPAPSSTYIWSTINGHIASTTNVGTSIYVDTPGIYIVTQYLQVGCSAYATDTVQVYGLDHCETLPVNNLINFAASLQNEKTFLNWAVRENQLIRSFDIERSLDGIHFSPVEHMNANAGIMHNSLYNYTDDISHLHVAVVYYRLVITEKNGAVKYSNVIRLVINGNEEEPFAVMPNPVRGSMQMVINSKSNSKLEGLVFDNVGKTVCSLSGLVQSGKNVIVVNEVQKFPAGIYTVWVKFGGNFYNKRILVMK